MVTSLAFSPDGKLLATGSFDKTVKLWDPQAGALLATLASVDTHGDYITWTPEGHFVATPTAEKHVNVRIGNQVEPLGQYRDLLYRPDLVAKRLAGKPVEPPR